MAQAIRLALHYAEEHLGVTDIFGEDVGPPLGGVFTCTQGLTTAWSTPLDERGIVGAAIGLALAGQRPIAEIQFCDYIYNTIDLLKLAGNIHWSSNGDWAVPMVVMTPVGSGIRGSVYHSHSFDAAMTHIAGWKVVMPSTPVDAYGLMLAACREQNPVMYLIPKALMRVRTEERLPGEPAEEKKLSSMIDAPLGDRASWVPHWPPMEELLIPIGKAKVVRPGQSITAVSYGRTLPLCVAAAEVLAQEGVEVEVIDLRTLWPYDWPALEASVAKTGRVLFVNEDTEVTNFGEHLARRTTDQLFYRLLAPPKVLAGKFVPGIGLADPLEMASVPQAADIERAMRDLANTHP